MNNRCNLKCDHVESVSMVSKKEESLLVHAASKAVVATPVHNGLCRFHSRNPS